MSYADPSDVAVELGRPVSSVTPEEDAQWQAWLDKVERAIVRAFRRANLVLVDQVALGDPTEDEVRDVEVSAVFRMVIHAERKGRESSTRSVDDASVTDRWKDDADALSLTDAEWNTLLPGSDSQAFSTRPGFEPDTEPDAWVWA